VRAPHEDAVASAPQRESRRARFWKLFPFGLLGTMLLGWGYMVSVALDDPSFSVEKEYYAKAVDWDAHQAQLARNRELGWQIHARLDPEGHDMRLAVTVVDRRGAQVRGARVAVEAFPVARGTDLIEASLVARHDGSYSALLPMRRPGIWEFRYSVERSGEVFTSVQREELVRGGPS
jgi:hypothetical protein